MSIDINDLTKGLVAGTGNFDVLMRAVDAHLESQFKDQRLTGADYANVYLGSITAVLAQASQYTLGAEQLNHQILLLEQQTEAAKQNVELVKAQIANINADTALKQKQLLKLEEDIALVIEQTKLVTAQTLLATKDIEVKEVQIAQGTAQTALIEQQTTNAVTQGSLLKEQVTKTQTETAVMAQKLVTETAQTEGDSNTVGGVLGKQMKLMDKQAEGFDRNAEQKLAKMMIDTWTVRQTTDGAETAHNGLVDTEINKVLNKAKEGIGVQPFVG